MKAHYLIILALLTGYFNYAQETSITQDIRGIVRDAESQQPIPGVNVLVSDMDGKGASTDINGEFEIKDIPVGRHDFRFSFISYKSVIRNNVQISSGKELYLEIEMTESVQQLEEVVVKANNSKDKPINKMASVSARSFNIEETERYAGSLGDPSRMAQNFAGVISAGDQRNDIIIRGNSPTGLLWRLDGVPIPNPNHFGAMGSTGGPVSMLNNNLLRNSDFFTGAFPAEFGNALSGVFDLNMRHGNNQTRQYVFQVGFNGFEGGAEGPFSKSGRSTYLINYRYSTLAVIDMLGLSGNASGGAVPQYQDLSFKLHFPTKKAGTFSLSGIGGKSSIEFEQDNENDNTYNNADGINTRNGSDMGFVTLSHRYFFNEKTRIRSYISASAYQVQTQVDSIEYTDNTQEEIKNRILYYDEHNKEYKLNAGTQLKTKINSKNYLITGLSLQSTQVNYMDSALYDIDSVSGNPDYKYLTQTNITGDYLNLLQAFGQWKHKFTDKLTFYGGLHAQYLLYNNSRTLEPRTSIEYQINGCHTVSVGYGLHSMMHPGITYFTQTLTDTLSREYRLTNTDLDFSKSHQSVLSWDFLITPDLRLKTETYYQYLYDVPAQGVFSNLNFGAGFNFPRVDSLENIGKGKNYGMELTIEKFLSDQYYFLVTASLFESQFKNPDGKWRNTAFNNQYIINALGGVEIPIKNNMFLNINLKTVYGGGNPLLAVDKEKSMEYNTTIYDYTESYKERSPAYFRIDSRISLKINGKKVSHEYALDLQNLTNHENVFNTTWDNNQNAVVYNYQQGFYPMFLYRMNF